MRTLFILLLLAAPAWAETVQVELARNQSDMPTAAILTVLTGALEGEPNLAKWRFRTEAAEKGLVFTLLQAQDALEFAVKRRGEAKPYILGYGTQSDKVMDLAERLVFEGVHTNAKQIAEMLK